MKLYTDACYNPFFVDVDNKCYEINNILFFDKSGVICATGRGWFNSNNYFRKGLELPTTCTLKRKADFAASSAFITVTATKEKSWYSNKSRYDLYIPAAVVGLKPPTARRYADVTMFMIEWKTDIDGVFVECYKPVDENLRPIRARIKEIGKSLECAYKIKPETLQAAIKELQKLHKEYNREYEKMLAISADEILQAYRRAE